MPDQAELIADIRPGQAQFSHLVLDGWGEPEGGHRWAVGRESRIALPVKDAGPDCVVVIDFEPWCDSVHIPKQSVMLAINGRLLATETLNGRRVFGYRLPVGLGSGMPVLSLCHLNNATARPSTGQDHAGLPLGSMVISVRLVRLPEPPEPARTRAAFNGSMAHDVLPALVEQSTGLAPVELVGLFEAIGVDCEVGLIQRFFGAEPLGLLRFAGSVTDKLADGLMHRFKDLGRPETTDVVVEPDPVAHFKVVDRPYYLWFNPYRTTGQATEAELRRAHCRRMPFLRRKFLEDIAVKICVLTRAEKLTEAEALAVFCALRVAGGRALLWTTHGDTARTGEVEYLAPGFMRGHLGAINIRNFGNPEAWLHVLANAYLLSQPQHMHADG